MDPKTPNDSIETENKETIEQILRFHECDESIIVKMIIVMAGSQVITKFDNYMSVVKRLGLNTIKIKMVCKPKNIKSFSTTFLRTVITTCQWWSVWLLVEHTIKIKIKMVCKLKILNHFLPTNPVFVQIKTKFSFSFMTTFRFNFI